MPFLLRARTLSVSSLFVDNAVLSSVMYSVSRLFSTGCSFPFFAREANSGFFFAASLIPLTIVTSICRTTVVVLVFWICRRNARAVSRNPENLKLSQRDRSLPSTVARATATLPPFLTSCTNWWNRSIALRGFGSPCTARRMAITSGALSNSSATLIASLNSRSG